jgi:putative transposase
MTLRIEDENAKLKKLLAEQMLDNAILKDVAAKNGNALCKTDSRRARCGVPRRERAAGVPGFERRSCEPSLPGATAG